MPHKHVISPPQNKPGGGCNRSLTTYLDLALLSTRRLKVAFSDTLRHPPPKLPTLPFVHLVDRRNVDLLFGTLHVRERLAGAKILASEVPQPLKRALRVVRPRRRQHAFELVRLAAKVALALVFNL